MSAEIVENVVTALPLGTWHVNAAKSRIGFDARHLWGLATVHGRFDSFRGTLVSQEHGVGGELSIDAASVETKNAKRDKHLAWNSAGMIRGDAKLALELELVRVD
jgi:polyisoprenoid-binding protein YceI